jgi:hypothetical protein
MKIYYSLFIILFLRFTDLVDSLLKIFIMFILILIFIAI